MIRDPTLGEIIRADALGAITAAYQGAALFGLLAGLLLLFNVEQLLKGQGADVNDLVSAITYLKEPEFMQPFRDVCRKRGFPERIPNTLCVADVCRPEWLCELEAIAVLS